MRRVAAAGITVAATIVATASGATLSSTGSGILFDGAPVCAKRSCPGKIYNGAIYVVSSTGSRRRLTSMTSSNDAAAWSPDHRLIAFSRRNPGVGNGYDIYVMRANGSGVRRVTRSGNVAVDPAWSPDGRRIVYRANTPDGQNFDLYIVNANGSGRRRVTSNPDNIGSLSPAWSPNGARIAFERAYQDHPLGTGIYTISPTGKRLKRVAIGGIDPSWSPDGKWIAFGLDAGRGWEVKVVNSNGGRPRRLAAGLDPSWSPDGEQIAFVRNDSIAVMNANGSDVDTVAKRKHFVFQNPNW
jgi:Tol biopolymer transport system component